MGPGSRYTTIPAKLKKEFQLLKILMGLGGIQHGKEPREAERTPPQTSFQSEPQEVIITLLQLAKSERKCLFKENTIIPTAFVQTCFHACYRRVC